MEFEYEKTVDGIVITGYANTSKKHNVLTIPEEINGCEVVHIGVSSFADCGITELNLPKSIKSIKNSAFKYNEIQKLTLPEGLERIGENAFTGNEIESLIIPDSVSYIGEFAFHKNSIKELVIGTGMDEISSNCFSYNQLCKIKVPGNIKKIGLGAFRRNSMQSITLENGIEAIGEKAFSTDKIIEINHIDIPSSVRVIGDHAFTSYKMNSFWVEPGKSKILIGFSFVSIRKVYLYKEAMGSFFINLHPGQTYIYSDKIEIFERVKKAISNNVQNLNNSLIFEKLEYRKAIDKHTIESTFS